MLKEMLPSQEQLDYEATQRNVVRISKIVHEVMENWKKNKDKNQSAG